MPDTFTRVTTKSWGSRLVDSVGKVVAGIVMFVASFGLLFWNEGRTDISGVAAKADHVSSTEIADTSLEGALVSTTGEVTADELVGDLYLEDGEYLLVERHVEMYAWVEEEEERTETNLGGSETTTTTYTYTKEWTSNPRSTSEFADPEGHTNPGMTIKANEVQVGRFMVGAYGVDAGTVELPAADPLVLTEENTVLAAGAELASDEFVFLGTGTLAEPILGDIRVSYHVVPTGFTGTVFGKLSGDDVTMYVNEDGDKLFRLFEGSRDEAISTLHQEFVVTTWILRVVGFCLMWFGLMALVGPIAVLLDVLPFLGSTTRFIVGVVTFPVAFILSVITIVISMIIHNIVALVIVLALVIAGSIFGLKKLRKPAMAK